MTEPSTEAWRVFGLAPDGVLFAPAGPVYWPDASESLRLWSKVEQTAGCIFDDHPAPAEDCSCGLRAVQDRDRLVAFVERDDVLAEAGVLGRVVLSGRMLPGNGVDPPTTLRAERARIVEIHLGPAHATLAPHVAARYGEVEVFTYSGDEWSGVLPPKPDRVVPEDADAAFFADVLRAGFGNRDLSDPKAPKVLAESARDLVKMVITARLSIPDAARVVFDSDAQPTTGQVLVFLRSAFTHFAPAIPIPLGALEHQFTEPVGLKESIDRNFRNLYVNVISAVVARHTAAR